MAEKVEGVSRKDEDPYGYTSDGLRIKTKEQNHLA